jgi:hypothetical protein
MNENSCKRECNICNKTYSSASSLWNHNKKFHINKNAICSPTVKIPYANSMPGVVSNHHESKKNYNCTNCNKILSSRQNKWRHEKICVIKHNNNQIIEKQNEEIKKLKEQLNDKITNITNNTNNGTINNTNNIIINQIGKELVSSLPIKDILKIVRDGNNGPMTCIKKLNFNKNIPENHSFCATTLDGNHFTRINHKTQKPEKVNKMEFIDEILQSSLKFINNISFLIEFDESFRNKIPVEDQEKIKEIVTNQNKFHEMRNKKIFFNNINDMSYNFKELILSTWKLIQPENKEDTDSEECLFDENFDYNSSDSENEISL